MSHVVALGGCGSMGRTAVRTLFKLKGNPIGRLTIADYDAAAAAAFANEIAASVDCVVDSAQVDAADEDRLCHVFQGAKVVLNTCGPFLRYGPPVMRASLRCGCHYVDICDSPEPTNVAFEYHEEAARKGLCFIIGVGASPGITNILARMVMDKLDSQEGAELHTMWGLGMDPTLPKDYARSALKKAMEEAKKDKSKATTEFGPAAAIHFVEDCLGKEVESFEGGKKVFLPPLRREAFALPGFGPELVAYQVGHPEPVTLPRTWPKLDRASSCIVMTDKCADGMRNYLETSFWNGKREARDCYKAIFKIGERGMLSGSQGPAHPLYKHISLSAAAIGDVAGRRSCVFACLRRAPTDAPGGMASAPGAMAVTTGMPAAIGVAMLLRGAVSTPGVYPPEAVIDPTLFFEDWGTLCGAAAPVHDTVFFDYAPLEQLQIKSKL